MKRLSAAVSILLLGGALSSASANSIAVIETSKGTITAQLFDDKTPVTVKNFIGLATGTKEYKDPKTGAMKKGKLYDGLTFHRVIPNFMIQGGDPLGTGTGGPGYSFQDEFVSSLTFDKPGKLAMANSGPGTNGSQFFITVAATPWLNNHHTIFGEVTSGQDVVDAIANAPKDGGDHPTTPIVIKHITIKPGK
jgi:peptidyl-prolyl cis-trans isomerase A (cyclophilin A)